MQYKVLKIEEDMDFGCEERQPGEALMSVVLMEDENGNETSLRHDDGLLYSFFFSLLLMLLHSQEA